MLANGDLRNVIASVNGIPKGHAAPITCVINTQDPTYMGQSLLLLLVAMSFSPRIACEIMTHLWYSARLTGNMVALVSEKLRPLIAAVVENCKDSGEDDLVKKIFTFGTSSLCVHLEKEKWVSMLALFDFDHGKAQTEANRKRVMLDGEYLDYRERHLFNLSPSRRLSTQRMRETGVLLPFGTLLDDFSCPNPTLFDTKTGSWLLNHSSDPMSSWPLDEVIVSGLYHGVPKEDLYGHLYFHVRDQCELFCYNLAKTIVDFHFYNQDVTHLRSVLKDTLSPHVDSGFDRIDASTIADTIGIQRTLLALGPLLQTPEQKPDAVLITQHLEAMTEAQATLDSTYLISSLTEREWGIINQCADMEAVNQDRASIHEGLLYVLPSYLRLFGALEIVRDYDRLFGIWLVNVLGFDNVCVATGMEIGGPNIIVDAWPTRMKKHAGEEGAQEEFNIILQSASKGKERVVEWIRAYPGSSHWDEIVAKEEKEKVGYAESSAGKKPEVSKDEAAGSEKWAWEK